MAPEVYVRELGAGPAVLLLHGTLMPAAVWQPVAEQLASRYRVLVPDLPGYGSSPAPEDASVDAVNAVVASTIAARCGRQLHAIVGISSGAYRALELVVRERLTADLVISLGGLADLDPSQRQVRGELAGALEADPGFLHGAAMQKALHDLMLSPGRTDDLSAWLASTTAAALAAELRAQTTMRDLSADLADLATRIYLRVGALDLACPPACSEAILRSAPRASLELVDGAGHALLTEDLTATTAAIERELARR